MSQQKEWELLEKEIDKHFPGAKLTSGSGRLWGDGDRVHKNLAFEAKRHARVQFDSWWEQTRRQADKWARVPILVIWRPPVQLLFGKSITDEVLAVCPLSYLGRVHQEIDTLKEQVMTLAKANKKLRDSKDGQ